MKKLKFLIIFLVVLFIFFLFITSFPKNYKIEYQIDKINVLEEYNKKDKLYIFEFDDSKNTYKYAIKENYINERKLIKKISIKDNCLNAKSDYFEKITLCIHNDEYVTKYYDEKVEFAKIDTYKNIDIYDLNQKKYLVWNYTEFLSISEDSKKTVNLFSKDIYELEIITKYKNYLVVADYNEKYFFDKLYLINVNNGKYQELKLDKNLYFDGYILGNYKKWLYYFDFHEESMYKINLTNGETEKTDNKYLLNGKFEVAEINELKQKNIYFNNENLFGFILKNKKLYYYTPVSEVLVTNLLVERIIQSSENDCFFISGDSLYYLKYNEKLIKVMSYSEWQFNNKNIYIFE